MADLIVVESPADMHVHLRQDAMSSLVVPHVRKGGITTAYVMPNTIPPLTSVDQCMTYLDMLESHDPSVELFGTLYLHPSLTPQEIIKAAQTKSKRGKRRIMGVKSYPRGVTTNSEGGIESYETYYPIFEEMERQDMVLNLHGEVPSNEEQVWSKTCQPKERMALMSIHPCTAEHHRSHSGSCLPDTPTFDTQAISSPTNRLGTRYDGSISRSSEAMWWNSRMYNYTSPPRSHSRWLGW